MAVKICISCERVCRLMKSGLFVLGFRHNQCGNNVRCHAAARQRGHQQEGQPDHGGIGVQVFGDTAAHAADLLIGIALAKFLHGSFLLIRSALSASLIIYTYDYTRRFFENKGKDIRRKLKCVVSCFTFPPHCARHRTTAAMPPY